ncbi:type II secretion system protein [bacterium]|nr:type II secretion system protein [bacterium]
MRCKNTFDKEDLAFTMGEVLVTLGIIGIVASMTLPSLIRNWKDKQFKTAYKKAYSDLSQAFQEALFEQTLTRRNVNSKEATNHEFAIMKSKFKVITECPASKISNCWKKGDTLCGGSCSSGNADDGIDLENGAPSKSYGSSCFIDASGRSWCTYTYNENIFVVDTNGFSNANRFGKDRFVFTFKDGNGNRSNNAATYKRIGAYSNADKLTQTSMCKHPPCYYQSWLLD